MSFWKWHEKLVKKMARIAVNAFITGKIILIFTLGAYFSIELVKHGYHILIVSTVLLIYYIQHNFLKWHENKKIHYVQHIIGWFGLLLLVLFLGIQSPHLPLKITLITGIVFIVLGMMYWIRGK